MKKHWHSIYVTQTVKEAVESLCSAGIKVDYNPKPEDLEDANGYIEQDGGTVSSCVRWRKVGNPQILAKVPEDAMACLQLLSSATNFETILSIVAHNLDIVQDCDHC